MPNFIFTIKLIVYNFLLQSVGISEYQTVNGDNREGAVTPSNILLDSESKKQAGLSDALIKDTGDGAVAEITQQDVAGFYILEVEMRNQRINVRFYPYSTSY